MIRYLIPLAAIFVVGCTTQAVPEMPIEISCRGRIESFSKNGFQALDISNGCMWSDITWVIIESPIEFSGVRHMILSAGGANASPLGSAGAVVNFSAYRSTLESEKDGLGRIDAKKLLRDLDKTSNARP